jgi:hypothetical protein
MFPYYENHINRVDGADRGRPNRVTCPLSRTPGATLASINRSKSLVTDCFVPSPSMDTPSHPFGHGYHPRNAPQKQKGCRQGGGLFGLPTPRAKKSYELIRPAMPVPGPFGNFVDFLHKVSWVKVRTSFEGGDPPLMRDCSYTH